MGSGAIILSGGKSSRMGKNKALLPIGEQLNIERIVSELKPQFRDLILVTNDPENYRFLNLPTVSDHYPGKGPLAGVHAGLQAASHEVNVIVACDMPFISAELATAMIGHIDNYDAVVPVIDGKQHPLFSVFKKTCLALIEDRIVEDRLRMKHVLEELNVRYVTEEDFSMFDKKELQRYFFNMNHPNEYEEAKRWAETESQEGK